LEVAYKIITVVAIFVAVVFVLVVLVTGKGDAMSGGSSGVRTTFKGKAGFEDKMYVMTMWLGGIFMFLMVLLDFLAERAFTDL